MYKTEGGTGAAYSGYQKNRNLMEVSTMADARDALSDLHVNEKCRY